MNTESGTHTYKQPPPNHELIGELDEHGHRWLLKPQEGTLSAEEFRAILSLPGGLRVGVEVVLEPFPIRAIKIDHDGTAHLHLEAGTPMSADQVLQLTAIATAIVLGNEDEPQRTCTLKRECYVFQHEPSNETIVCFNAGYGPYYIDRGPEVNLEPKSSPMIQDQEVQW